MPQRIYFLKLNREIASYQGKNASYFSLLYSSSLRNNNKVICFHNSRETIPPPTSWHHSCDVMFTSDHVPTATWLTHWPGFTDITLVQRTVDLPGTSSGYWQKSWSINDALQINVLWRLRMQTLINKLYLLITSSTDRQTSAFFQGSWVLWFRSK